MMDATFPTIHPRPAQGWLNDPNGLAKIDGRYHVFFQHNPIAPTHGSIHWGHQSSADLVHWREEPIALTPRTGQPDSAGCWSGSLVVDGDTPTLLYTAVDSLGPLHAVALRAVAEDGDLRVWDPDETPISGSGDPVAVELRDPYPFLFDGRRYVVQGGGMNGTPHVEVYAAEDLSSWTPVGAFLDPADPVVGHWGEGYMWECPNLVPVGEQWLLVLSMLEGGPPMRLAEVVWFLGDVVATESGPRFRPQTSGLVDHGDSFYAPQVLRDDDRLLMWGWARETRPESQAVQTGWSGSLTLPRELSVRDGRLRTALAPELEALRREPLTVTDGPITVGAFELVGLTDAVTVEVTEGGVNRVVFAWEGEPASVRIVVDHSVVEAFVDGVATTTRAYPDDEQAWSLTGGVGLTGWVLAVPSD